MNIRLRYQNAWYMIAETYLNGGGTGGAACCWAAKGLDTDPPIESGPRPMAECWAAAAARKGLLEGGGGPLGGPWPDPGAPPPPLPLAPACIDANEAAKDFSSPPAAAEAAAWTAAASCWWWCAAATWAAWACHWSSGFFGLSNKL